MKRITLKQALLTSLVALLAMSWVGSVSSMGPGWTGFHANLKGFPGGDQDTHIIKGPQNGVQSVDTLQVLTVSDDAASYAPYKGFSGAKEGNYPGGRPGLK